MLDNTLFNNLELMKKNRRDFESQLYLIRNQKSKLKKVLLDVNLKLNTISEIHDNLEDSIEIANHKVSLLQLHLNTIYNEVEERKLYNMELTKGVKDCNIKVDYI